MDSLSEQQRVLLAVVLSVGILLGWQFFFAPPAPVNPPSVGESTAVEGEPDGAAPEAPKKVGDEPTPAEPAETPLAEDSEPSAEGAVVEPVPAPAAPVVAQTRSFETNVLRGVIGNVDGHLERLELKEYSEHDGGEDAEPQPVDLVAREGGGANQQAKLEFDFGPVQAPALDFTGGGLSLSGANASLKIDVEVVPEAYSLRYRISAQNVGSSDLSGVARVVMALNQTGEGRSMFSPAADVVSGLCFYEGGVDRDLVSSLVEEPVDSTTDVLWAGIDRQYFVLATVPVNVTDGKTRCTMRGDDSTAFVTLELPVGTLAPGAEWKRDWVVFAGPKRNDALEAVSPTLGAAIEYDLWGIPLGAIARPMVFLLNLFHGWFGNWGLAIIMLTLTVKLALFPVTYRSALSMRKMQEIRPQIEKIKQQYENDRERQQLEQMKLMREAGVNPLGGCLPLFLQMPIWFALYRTLWTSVDLYQQSFLWIPDLTAAEAFPFLAIVVGGLTFLQQRLQPAAIDNQQMKVMMYTMPVMFTFFMFALPSGLVLYILVNSALTIIQQLVINRGR
ncbi:MAG: membrane protein insertase YidC [Myxococcota bacterium]